VTPVVTWDEVAPADEGPRTGPRLAVVVSLNFPDMTEVTAELVRRFTRTALTEAARLGFDWFLVDTSADLPDPEETRADAVLVLGGGDVDSELYGVPGPVAHEYGVDPIADRFTIEVIRQAVARDVPLLAICRGSQLLNLSFGGTLVPDLVDWTLHRGDYVTGPLFLNEHVRILPGTRLHEILGVPDLVVRSGHHQAVAQVAPALRAAALADDGVVEAVEHPGAWAIGVQWHPEDDDGHGDDRRALFGALRKAAEGGGR
jgi:putative glutamine amidotransferase